MLKIENTEALQAKLQEIAVRLIAKAVTAGVHEDAGVDSKGVSNVAKAHWNEFGTETIPSRPFMRFTISKNQDVYQQFMRNMINDIVHNRITTDYAFNALGTRISKDLKEAVRTWSAPSNSASTIMAKGRDDPLVDTKAMMNSISFKIEE